jgi:hypothetical protein
MKIITRSVLAATMAIVLVRCGDSKSPTESAQPQLSPGIVAGNWTGTYRINDHDLCNFRDVPANATFRQEGSAVGGTLVIERATCGLGTLDFEGAMNGNGLSGRVLAAGNVVASRVSGSITSMSLSIDLGKDNFGFEKGSFALRR